MIHALLVAHIAVLGYWLGSELVINSTFRYACFRDSLPIAERDHLMHHVLNVDQHVRYALVLQFGVGFALAFLLGYLPGGVVAAWLALVIGLFWLVLVEVIHRRRLLPVGASWARFDRGVRYVLMAGLAAMAGLALLSTLPALARFPGWLAWKLLGFAAVMACGVGIRLALWQLQPTWQELLANGSTPALEQRIRAFYWRGTGILFVLWAFIALIVLLSVIKPA